MKKLFTLAFILCAFGISAQYSGQIASNLSAGGSNVGDAGAAIQNLLGPISDAYKKRTFSLDDFQGSPYTSNEFKPAKLSYKDEVMGNLYYRYNAYNEEIEIKQQNLENEGIRALGRDKDISIDINGKPMSFKTFIDKKGNTQNGYLTQLSDGKYPFYKRTDVKYTEGQKAQNSFVKAIPARFSKFTEYYLELKEANRIDELELSNRKLIKLMPNDKKEGLKAYLKENKIRINDEEDVFLALEYLNQ